MGYKNEKSLFNLRGSCFFSFFKFSVNEIDAKIINGELSELLFANILGCQHHRCHDQERKADKKRLVRMCFT